MVRPNLKEQTRRVDPQAPTIAFRLAYYAICTLIAGALVGALYLGGLLQ